MTLLDATGKWKIDIRYGTEHVEKTMAHGNHQLAQRSLFEPYI
jgi:hypothetical protein